MFIYLNENFIWCRAVWQAKTGGARGKSGEAERREEKAKTRKRRSQYALQVIHTNWLLLHGVNTLWSSYFLRTEFAGIPSDDEGISSQTQQMWKSSLSLTLCQCYLLFLSLILWSSFLFTLITIYLNVTWIIHIIFISNVMQTSISMIFLLTE